MLQNTSQKSSLVISNVVHFPPFQRCRAATDRWGNSYIGRRWRWRRVLSSVIPWCRLLPRHGNWPWQESNLLWLLPFVESRRASRRGFYRRSDICDIYSGVVFVKSCNIRCNIRWDASLTLCWKRRSFAWSSRGQVAMLCPVFML